MRDHTTLPAPGAKCCDHGLQAPDDEAPCPICGLTRMEHAREVAEANAFYDPEQLRREMGDYPITGNANDPL